MLELTKPVEVIQVIVTNLTVRGTGKKDNHTRTIRQFWLMDGTLLFEVEPYADYGAYKPQPLKAELAGGEK